MGFQQLLFHVENGDDWISSIHVLNVILCEIFYASVHSFSVICKCGSSCVGVCALYITMHTCAVTSANIMKNNVKIQSSQPANLMCVLIVKKWPIQFWILNRLLNLIHTKKIIGKTYKFLVWPCFHLSSAFLSLATREIQR